MKDSVCDAGCVQKREAADKARETSGSRRRKEEPWLYGEHISTSIRHVPAAVERAEQHRPCACAGERRFGESLARLQRRLTQKRTGTYRPAQRAPGGAESDTAAAGERSIPRTLHPAGSARAPWLWVAPSRPPQRYS